MGKWQPIWTFMPNLERQHHCCLQNETHHDSLWEGAKWGDRRSENRLHRLLMTGTNSCMRVHTKHNIIFPLHGYQYRSTFSFFIWFRIVCRLLSLCKQNRPQNAAFVQSLGANGAAVGSGKLNTLYSSKYNVAYRVGVDMEPLTNQDITPFPIAPSVPHKRHN